MSRIVLDTNFLVQHWHQSREGPLANRTVSDAKNWARALIKIHQTNAIVTPVYLEFVGGVVNGHEMELSKAYLDQFQIIDEGKITSEDCKLARQLAERIPPGPEPTPRGAVDCLIKALAGLRRYEVRSSDKGMPR